MLVAGMVSAGPSYALVGGQDATVVYKGMAALEMSFPEGTGLCGAYVIAERWAATNAHCVTNAPPDFSTLAPSALNLRVGTNNRTTAPTVLVDQVLVHAGWQWGIGAPALPVNDIALLHLTKRVKGDFDIAWHPDTRKATTLIGYGLVDAIPTEASEPAVRLQQLDGARILPSAECEAAFIGARELCVSNVDGTKGVCFGDSGSPVLQYYGGPGRHGRVIGSNSRGVRMQGTCGTGPEVITDVTAFRGWIGYVMLTRRVPPVPASEAGDVTTRSAGDAPKAMWWIART